MPCVAWGLQGEDEGGSGIGVVVCSEGVRSRSQQAHGVDLSLSVDVSGEAAKRETPRQRTGSGRHDENWEVEPESKSDVEGWQE